MNRINILIIFLLFIFGCSSKKQTNEQQQPNVLFISVDDLNNCEGALLGHPQAITPNMDKLFGEGVLFTNAHASQPVCTVLRLI